GVVDRRLSVEGMIKFHWWDFGKLQVDKGPHILGLERDFDAARQIIPFADFGGDYCAVSLWPRHRHYVGGHLFWLLSDTGRWPVPLRLIGGRRRRDCRGQRLRRSWR